MKKNIFKLILIFTVVAIFASCASSTGNGLPAKKAATGKTISEIPKITGKLTGYNWSNSTITISASAGSSLTIVSDKNTLISKGGKNIKLTDIKSGDIVTVTYESKKGVNTAKSIIVQEKGISSSIKSKIK